MLDAFISRWASSDSWSCGRLPKRATRRRLSMFDYIVSGIVAVLLLVYLGWAMFQPEKVLRVVMTTNGVLQILVFFGITVLVTKPLGLFMSRLFQGERTFLHPLCRPLEVLVYKLCGVRENDEQRWTQYTASLLSFSLIGFLFHLRADAPAGPAAAQSSRIRRQPGEPRPGVQHVHELHDEHRLAVVQRRVDDELSRPDGRARRPELRVRGGRHRGGDRRDSRLCPRGNRPARKLLGRSDAHGCLHPAPALHRHRPVLLLAGRDPEFPSLHGRQDGRRRHADDRAGSGRLAGGHQADRDQWRRVLQRQLRASVREPDAHSRTSSPKRSCSPSGPGSPIRSATWSRTRGKAGPSSGPWRSCS